MKQGEWASAAKAFSLARRAAEVIYQQLLLPGSQWTELAEAGDLYADSCFVLARLGRLDQAAAVLEGGRARVLNAALERNRIDLKTVERLDEQAAHRFVAAVETRRAVESEEREQRDSFSGGLAPTLRREVRELAVRAAVEFEEAVVRIRRLPGFEQFLVEPSWDEIVQSAAVPGGPALVYMVATRVGGVALVVTRSHDGGTSHVDAVWLPTLRVEDIARLLAGAPTEPGGWLGAYATWRTASNTAEARAIWFDEIDSTTNWLWTNAMGPVLDTLQAHGASSVVLIPTGLLSLLPLHAAWTQATSSVDRVYALDSVEFSYAPSARAYVSARTVAESAAGGRLVAVAPTPDTLPASVAEVDAIAALFDAPQVVWRHDVTRAAVLKGISETEFFHFAGHGFANWMEPLKSGLFVANAERLTVADLMSIRLQPARLASLSACETGIIGTELLDEVVALPSALQQAGFAGVVASLWAVDDASTSLLMHRFYQGYKVDGLTPAAALRAAQRWLRDTSTREKLSELVNRASGTRHEQSNVQRLLAPIVSPLATPLVESRDPVDSKSYAHPYYWAAFSLTGA